MPEDVDYDAIMRNMNRPQIPEVLPDWFRMNQRSLANSDLVSNLHLIRANSWINVEVAAVFISSFFRKACEDCDDRVKTCKSCGRAEENFKYCMTGNRDSDWLVFELFSSIESELMNKADGLICFFDPDIYPTIDLSTSKISFASQQMVPVHLGSLELNPYQKDSAMLFIGDGSASIDGSDFVAGVVCSPGRYEVVAWVGWTSTGDLAPCALFIYGPKFQSSFKVDTALQVELPNNVEGIISGSGETSVFARIGNNQEYYAEMNSTFYDDTTNDSWVCKNSWTLLLGFLQDPEKWKKDFREFEAPLGQRLLILDCLRIRGQRAAFLELTDYLLSSQDPELGRLADLIHLLRSLPAGARYQEVVS